jgi:hypothetical protein
MISLLPRTRRVLSTLPISLCRRFEGRSGSRKLPKSKAIYLAACRLFAYMRCHLPSRAYPSKQFFFSFIRRGSAKIFLNPVGHHKTIMVTKSSPPIMGHFISSNGLCRVPASCNGVLDELAAASSTCHIFGPAVNTTLPTHPFPCKPATS